MNSYSIQGGTQLEGTIEVQGAKNSVLPILAGTLLATGETVLHNCPDLTDVSATLTILELLGCTTRREGSTVYIRNNGLTGHEIPCELMLKMRSSVLFLGGLLGKVKSATLCKPGGCQLGPRPIDYHLQAFRSLGVTMEEQGDDLICTLSPSARGKEVYLPFPSVGATENLMLLACGILGTTTLIGVAREPEIVDLQEFLKAMGAKVTGAGTSTIVIEGGKPLTPAEFTVMGDRIVATTYLSAAAITGGTVLLSGVKEEYLTSVLSVFSQMGCQVSLENQSLRLSAPKGKELSGVPPLQTAPYPAFPTDAQALLMAVLTQGQGSTLMEEKMFDSRFHHVDELRKLGAKIEISSRVAMVTGKSPLVGATMYGRDLRGTAALIVAALAAEGESRVFGLEHLERGYERLDLRLQNMGAKVLLHTT